MRKLLLLFLLNYIFSCTSDSTSEITENIFTGDVNLLTQEEVELFGSNNYTEIIGDLNIGDPNFGTDINDLEPLSSIEEVGNLYISVDELTNLNGLHNLSVINESFYIRSVGNMLDFDGLNSLSEINGDFRIVRSYFQNLNGLDNLSIISGNFEISLGYSLTSLSGLQLTTLGGDFYIGGCNLITSLIGAETLTTINGDLYIQGNDNLTSLNGLQNLLEINDVTIGGQSIYGSDTPNELLSDFCDLTNLFLSGTFNEVTITNNLYNPTAQDIANNNCSL